MIIQQATASKLKSVLCFLFLSSMLFYCKFSYAEELTDIYSTLVFNEIMASNTTIIKDRDGDYPDWIEIYNSGNVQVDLTGCGLSDDPEDPFKWIFPDAALQPGEFKLIFASDKDYRTENPYLHTNFKIKAGGETLLLSDTTGFVFDQVSTLEISSDLSWGRQPDGGADWLFFTDPTPGAANNSTGFPAFSSPVTFSKTGGFYQGNLSVELTTNSPAAEIRCTLDGSEPQRNSSLYTESIQLDRTMVVRARSFEPGKLPGKVVTHTYFINEETNLPVISLSTDPANMFDRSTGIYTNYNQNWERPVHFEFYETDGLQKVSADGGIKIGGGATRGRPQKAFHINFRGRYGATKIEYQIFPDLPVYEFNTLFLRAAGNDWDQTHFRDGLLQKLVRDLDFDTQAYRPSVIFLNGAYWGILNIRERFTKEYLESHHGADPEHVDLLELAHPNHFISVLEGDLDRFNGLYEYIQNSDFNDDVHYEVIQTQMDISSFLDYVISEIYFNNTDWPTNNIKFWCPKTETGKFRWMLFDLDWSYGYQRTRVGPADANTYKANTLTYALGTDQLHIGLMLRKFLENDQFKAEFINRFADYLNTVFYPDHVLALVAKIQENLESEMPNHYQRFKTVPISEWYRQITILKNFATYRPFYIREHIRDYFGLTKTIQLNVQMTPAGSGNIQLNHIRIKEDAWLGDYFTDIPVTLTAVPNTGYRFTGWTGDIETDSATLTRSLSESISLTAHFGIDENADPGIVINEINYHSAVEFDPGDWLELHNVTHNTVNVSGWTLLDENDSTGFRIPSNTILAPDGYVVLCQDVRRFNQLFPETNNAFGDLGFGLNNAGELIRLYNSDGVLVDSVAYDDASPWPVQPDGHGPALMLRDAQLDNSAAQNWMSSNKYGTPGEDNVFLTVSVKAADDIPKEFQLCQNFPNPFNACTKITYSIARSGYVSIKLYDLLGREIQILVSEFQEANTYHLNLEANQLASGLYFYRLQAGNRVSEIKQMLLIR